MFMYAYKHVSVMLRVCVLEHSVHVHFQASVLWGIVLIVDKYQPILCLLVDHPPKALYQSYPWVLGFY